LYAFETFWIRSFIFGLGALSVDSTKVSRDQVFSEGDQSGALNAAFASSRRCRIVGSSERIEVEFR
jgi:hypothetical protein